MVSRLLRRSGVAMVQFSEWLDWIPDVVVQVGVGLRCDEVPVMQEAWPGVTLIGFEPNERIYKQLEGTYPGSLNRCALGERCGQATLYTKEKHKDGSSLHPHKKPPKKGKLFETEVRVSTLDDVFPVPGKFGKHILLWLDCEGSELSVLRGGERFIRHVGVVNVELTSNPPGFNWCKPLDVHKWLNEHNMLRVWHHTERTCAGQTDAIYTKRLLFRPEYCCCPCQQELYERGADV